jgi:hypothetical protein
MHFASTLSTKAVDSLGVSWNGPNDGTRRALTVTLINRYGETWDHARVLFNLADNDSSFTATGGTVAQVIRQGGIANVSVDCTIPASGTIAVSVQPDAPLAVTGTLGNAAFALRAPSPNPLVRAAGAPLLIHWTLPASAPTKLEVFDAAGRRVATLLDREVSAGEHEIRWDGRTSAGPAAGPGLYLLRLTSGALSSTRRVALID